MIRRTSPCSMRFFALALLLPGLAAALAAQASPPPASPQAPPPSLEATPAVVEFGDVYEGEVLKQTLSFTNQSEGDWPVRQVSTSCGCTLARMIAPDGTALSTKPRPDGTPLTILTPGQTFQVEVEFLTSNQRGKVEKTVRVVPADPAIPALTVPVRARVSRALAINPGIVNLGSVTKTQVVEHEIVIESQDIGDWKVTGFESAIESLPLPKFVRLEALDSSGSRRRIRLSLDRPRPVGPMSARVRVIIEHDRIGFVDFYLTGHVEPDVVFTSGHPTFPKSLSFDQVEPGSKETRTLTIRNSDPDTPYELRTADLHTVDSEYFTVAIRAIEPGVHYEVDLTVDGSLERTFFRGNLVLRANHPDVPTKTIPFHGWIKASDG